ncbi:MAG: ATP-dependent sacrificial sulfur transferase LarE [Blastocatellia bacterium]|nr:ATP-dependent sacrificial sulfur transferase LarE [Blastocatellia bacterium]
MRSLGKVFVAYSGGVDSSYLAWVANAELGREAVCVLGLSPSVSEFQRMQARAFAELHGLNFQEIHTEEADDPNYQKNESNRCFFCKSELYGKLSEFAADAKVSVVLDGTNADDLSDHRPGREAAAISGVRSPLAEIGLTKDEIRELSRHAGLQTWDMPASPCLASRIAHGVPVTLERLSIVERGENALRRLGFREFRLRVHDELARVEIARPEMAALDQTIFEKIDAELRTLGFKYVTLDLGGFRSGSMNTGSTPIAKSEK